jgi:hypothetical protein
MDKPRHGIKVALVGPYPPPYGGVSIHAQRLHGQKAANDISITVFDHSRQVSKTPGVINLGQFWNWPRVLLSKQDIIHVHTSHIHWIFPAVFYYLSRLKGAKFIITFHSLRYGAREFGWIGSRMIRVVLSKASHCIATNEGIMKKLISMGARPEKISIIPAFLPPENIDEEITEIPQEVWDFMESHTPVISANAFSVVQHYNQDLYGIDMCIELCIRLKSYYPDIGFVFFLPEVGDYEYFTELKSRIAGAEIENNFFFQTSPCQFYPVLMKSDIFVRPTTSDGDAISLREALFFKIPSVASDAAPRPAGTLLFKNRDIEDFTSRLKMVWDNYKEYKAKAEALEIGSGLGEILAIYRRLTGKTEAV